MVSIITKLKKNQMQRNHSGTLKADLDHRHWQKQYIFLWVRTNCVENKFKKNRNKNAQNITDNSNEVKKVRISETETQSQINHETNKTKLSHTFKLGWYDYTCLAQLARFITFSMWLSSKNGITYNWIWIRTVWQQSAAEYVVRKQYETGPTWMEFWPYHLEDNDYNFLACITNGPICMESNKHNDWGALQRPTLHNFKMDLMMSKHKVHCSLSIHHVFVVKWHVIS